MTQVKFKPLPPTWNGKPWSSRLLKNEMSAAELKKVIALYGVNQINAACAITAARTAGGQQ